MQIEQLDLFNRGELDFVLSEMKKTRDLTENVRKGLFARYNSLERLVLDLMQKLESAKDKSK